MIFNGDNSVTIHKDDYEDLVKDAQLLYALRKIGAVPLELEAEALEFLLEEGMDLDE